MRKYNFHLHSSQQELFFMYFCHCNQYLEVMKIVIVGTAWPYRGGTADFNHRLALEFVREGHDVLIYNFTLQYPKIFFPGKTQYTSDPKPQELRIVRGLNSVNPFNWIKAGRELRKEEPDMVIVPFWIPYMAPCMGFLLRRLKKSGAKRVALLHNLIPHEHKPGDKILSRYFINSVDGYVALSKSVLHDIDLFDKKKPRYFFPHPLHDHFGQAVPREEALEHLGLDPSFRYILFFGLIREYKGLDILLRAYADSRLRKYNIRLLVFGEFYDDPKLYFNLEKELGLEGLVIWRNDFVPHDEVRYCFGAADIVAQTYRTATQSGVSQVAYHFVKPMLVTKVGGLAEIVPNGKVGYVVDTDTTQIADALVDFFENNRQDQFTEGINSEKKKYEWSGLTKSLMQAAKE